jgi:hypothetical protein
MDLKYYRKFYSLAYHGILFFVIFISGQTQVVNEKGKKVALSLVYPPPHLYHILFELFKNSMRAVVEKNQQGGARTDLPDIEVLVAKGEHDVSIRVSDQVSSSPWFGFVWFGLVWFGIV